MDFSNAVDSHRSQIKFYRLLCLALTFVLAILAVIVPSSLKTGPYVIQQNEGTTAVFRSQPWQLSVARIEGFLKLYLNARFEWSNETFESKKTALKQIVAEPVFAKLRDSVSGYGVLAKSQNARGFYVLEGFRFANDQHLIEAQISRVIRVGTTGVVTPLLLRISYEDAGISESNPHGLRVKAIEEGEPQQTVGVSK